MQITWLASYPKSGNTYLRMLLHNYLYGDVKNSVKIGERIPDLHKTVENNIRLEKLARDRLIVKTHFLHAPQHPYINDTHSFIYIMRNPRDVLLSNLRYFGANNDKQAMVQFSQSFIENLGSPYWKSMHMGNMLEHYSSWHNASDNYKGLFIKYEDLRYNTESTLAKVIETLGKKPDKNKIKKAVYSSTIEKARKLEKTEKSNKKVSLFESNPNGDYFIGEGKTNQSLAIISSEIEELYRKHFDKFAEQLGYEITDI